MHMVPQFLSHKTAELLTTITWLTWIDNRIITLLSTVALWLSYLYLIFYRMSTSCSVDPLTRWNVWKVMCVARVMADRARFSCNLIGMSTSTMIGPNYTDSSYIRLPQSTFHNPHHSTSRTSDNPHSQVKVDWEKIWVIKEKKCYFDNLRI